MFRVRVVLVLRNTMCASLINSLTLLAHFLLLLIGQMGAWKAHHKKLCRNFNTFTASNEYQALTPHDQVDALLLSQMIADSASWRVGQSASGPHATFLDLLKGPRADTFELPLCLPKGALPSESLTLAQELYGRFGNNNFALHSHLNAYANGIFPLASRLFNHSCVPNAACKYIIRASESVAMQVVALRDITEGEEVRTLNDTLGLSLKLNPYRRSQSRTWTLPCRTRHARRRWR